MWWATPRSARLYNGSVVVAAVAISLWGAFAGPGRGCLGATLALIAGGIAVVELGRLVEGGRVDRQRIQFLAVESSAWPPLRWSAPAPPSTCPS